MNATGPGISGYMLLLAVQIIFLIAYAAFVRYDNSLLPVDGKENVDLPGDEDLIDQEDHVPSYTRKSYDLPNRSVITYNYEYTCRIHGQYTQMKLEFEIYIYLIPLERNDNREIIDHFFQL